LAKLQAWCETTISMAQFVMCSEKVRRLLRLFCLILVLVIVSLSPPGENSEGYYSLRGQSHDLLFGLGRGPGNFRGPPKRALSGGEGFGGGLGGFGVLSGGGGGRGRAGGSTLHFGECLAFVFRIPKVRAPLKIRHAREAAIGFKSWTKVLTRQTGKER